jgi:DNA-binding MarR family transcriptional regulator
MEVTPQQLCDEVLNLLDNFKADFAAIADSCNLTKVQMFALYSISTQGELPMGQVAGALHCDPSNVTGIVDRLVTQDLIVREESLKDRRTKMLRLTEKGKKLVSQIESEMPARLACDKLDAPERKQLCTLLNKLNALHAPREMCLGGKQYKRTA